MIWFTADLHLGHQAILKMQHRPFDTIEVMNSALIRNINSCVGANDTLYILGDVSHHLTPEETDALVRKMHGKKYLILGNHDVTGNPETCPYDPGLYRFIGPYLKISAERLTIVMMHYPLLTWDKNRAGSIMLHGHIHSDPSYNEGNIAAGIRRYDVGVDANGYYPVSIHTVQEWAQRTGVSRIQKPEQYIPGVWDQYRAEESGSSGSHG